MMQLSYNKRKRHILACFWRIGLSCMHISSAHTSTDVDDMLEPRCYLDGGLKGRFLASYKSARVHLPGTAPVAACRFCSTKHRPSRTPTLFYEVHTCASHASDHKTASTDIAQKLRDGLIAGCGRDAQAQLDLDQTVACLQAVPEVQRVEFAVGERLHCYQQQTKCNTSTTSLAPSQSR